MENDGNASLNKGAWSADEDATLAQYVALHGPKRWKCVAIKSGSFIFTHTHIFSTNC